MEVLHNLANGFGIFFEPINLLYGFIGVLMGTLVGVLPGLGPPAAIALLLPMTFYAPKIASFVMLSGIYYGAMYGGSTTSILVNMPGETASVITCLDGYQMARKGKAGPALGISAIGSFIAGTFGVVGLMLFAPTLADWAVELGPPEYFSLAVLSLTLVTYVSKGPITRSLVMACVGVILSTAGMDPFTAQTRFTFGIPSLLDGFDLVYVAMGLFGMSEVLVNLGHTFRQEVVHARLHNLFPDRQDLRDSAMPIARGTILGFFLGIIPGFGGVVPTFLSYGLEKKLSKRPEQFGTGVIEGVAGPEAANNAGASGSFIPLLSLGIPTGPSMALLLGALMIYGVQPGPLLITSQPDLFWGVVASMYVGNALLLILNLPLIGIWVQILKIPYSILYVLIVILCQIGAYSVNNRVEDILLINLFGIAGYLMKRYGYEGAPLILGLVLGQMLEGALRRALMYSYGDPTIFLTRPISALLLLIALLFLIIPLFTGRRIGEKAIKMQED
ncbi:MAG: tripartite tricarboxylate transporter permease [Syntrophaceae bacterium]|nr:tripartite tricarboxylate transporter permease [Syntrophaceae bacterium]